jgi:translocation and assembly module TamB
LKKLFLSISILLLSLLGVLYFALNSPYLIERVAREYSPKFNISYDKVGGNPLQGVILSGLSYKGEKLSDTIRVNINPYGLLKGDIIISRLEILGVEVHTLESLINDFSSDSNSSEESSSTQIPLAIELKNIHLTLKPFSKMGIDIYKESLSVSSIYYDTGEIIVGDLKQSADTSIGNIKLDGTYHERVLKVDTLSIKDLDVARMQSLLANLSTDTDKTETDEKKDSDTTEESGEDPFIPKKVIAEHIDFSVKPFVQGAIAIDRARITGKKIEADLQHSKLLSGDLAIDIVTKLASAQISAHAEPEKLVVKRAKIADVSLSKIFDIVSSTDSESGKQDTGEKKEEKADSQKIPFLPERIEVVEASAILQPDSVMGVDYDKASISLHSLSIDVKNTAIDSGRFGAVFGSPLLSLKTSGDMDKKRIHFDKIEIADIDYSKIEKLVSKNDSNGTKQEKSAEMAHDDSAKVKKESSSDSVSIVNRIDIDSLKISAKPFVVEDISVESLNLIGREIEFDLAKKLFGGGKLKLDCDNSLSNIHIQSLLKDLSLMIEGHGKSRIILKKNLFDKYEIPLDYSAIDPVRLDGRIGEKDMNISIYLSGKNIVSDKNSTLSPDIEISGTNISYRYGDGKVSIVNKSLVSTAYTPSLKAGIRVEGDSKRGYSFAGRIIADKIKSGLPRIDSRFAGSELTFRGSDKKGVRATLTAGDISAKIVSDDFKKAKISIDTPHRIELSRYTDLPKNLKKALLSLHIGSTVNLQKPLPLRADISIASNIANLDAKLKYGERLSLDGKATIPSKSLLGKMDKNIILGGLSPMKISVFESPKSYEANFATPSAKISLIYSKMGELLGHVDIGGSKIKVGGEPSKDLTVSIHTPSIGKLLTNAKKIYKFEAPAIDGDLKADAVIRNLSAIDLKLRSSSLVTDSKARIRKPIKNIDLHALYDMNRSTLRVKSYSLETSGTKLFSKKESRLSMKKSKIDLEHFWLNDSLDITGYYDIAKKRGKFKGSSKSFHIVHENVDMKASIKIATTIDGEKIATKGDVVILGGKIKYNISKKHYATDEDIVIVQHMKEKQESFFEKNVKLSIHVDSRKPLVFKQKDVMVKIKPSLSIMKEFRSPLMMFGSIDLPKGGYYIFEGKKFVLKKSNIFFTGKPNAPMLNIHLVYKRYAKTIWISVAGSATEPALNFSSSPYMTRDQILSFILFDTTESDNTTGDMLSMVGGGIAKSLLGNMGLKVDTLVLKQDGFQVGEKISDKVSIIYDQQDESKMILRVEHSSKLETDISVGENSQSIDIIYKREF